MEFLNKSFTELGQRALLKTFELYHHLEESGKESVKKNRFGDTTLRMDINAEEEVLKFLKEENVPVRVISEEHGTTNIGENPKFLAVMDGLDGSSNYKESKERGRYGTMLGFFSNINPNYEDYIFSGIMEHATGKMFFASKGEGSFVAQKDKIIPIRTSEVKDLDKKTRIFIDEYWEFNKKKFSQKLQGFNTNYLGASCAYYIDLACGKADLVLECTRKGNLEVAISYGLEREAGAVIVDSEGKDLGKRKYLEFGQQESLPVISGATLDLTKRLIEHLNRI